MKRPPRSAAQRGNALVGSLAVVVIVGGLGAAMMQMQSSSAARHRETVDAKRALNVAEAGLAEAFYAVTMGKSGNVGAPDAPASCGKGLFWVEATEPAPGFVTLKSTGLCGVGRSSLAMTLQRQGGSVAVLGIFGAEELRVGASAVLDGFDSAAGTHESQAKATPVGLTTGEGARIRGNAGIRLDAVGVAIPGVPLPSPLPAYGTTVFGDATPGPSGSVIPGADVTITGSTAPAGKAAELLSIEVPEVDQTRTQAIPTAGDIVVGPIDKGFKTIAVPSGRRLVLRGPSVLVVETLSLANRAQLQLDTTGGAVSLYCTDTLSLHAGSTLSSVDRNPKRFALLAKGNKVTIASEGEFHGVLYAPDADVVLPGTLRLFGAAVVKSLTVGPGFRGSFDRALLAASAAPIGLPTSFAWKVVELPKSALVSSRIDALLEAKNLGITPKRPDKCHQEGTVDLKYVDASGNILTYSGSEDSIPWGAVKSVVVQSWR
jgi:hypothetical protein